MTLFTGRREKACPCYARNLSPSTSSWVASLTLMHSLQSEWSKSGFRARCSPSLRTDCRGSKNSSCWRGSRTTPNCVNLSSVATQITGPRSGPHCLSIFARGRSLFPESLISPGGFRFGHEPESLERFKSLALWTPFSFDLGCSTGSSLVLKV